MTHSKADSDRPSRLQRLADHCRWENCRVRVVGDGRDNTGMTRLFRLPIFRIFFADNAIVW